MRDDASRVRWCLACARLKYFFCLTRAGMHVASVSHYSKYISARVHQLHLTSVASVWHHSCQIGPTGFFIGLSQCTTTFELPLLRFTLGKQRQTSKRNAMFPIILSILDSFTSLCKVSCAHQNARWRLAGARLKYSVMALAACNDEPAGAVLQMQDEWSTSTETSHLQTSIMEA